MVTDTHEHRYLSVAEVALRLGISARALEDRLERYRVDGPEAA